MLCGVELFGDCDIMASGSPDATGASEASEGAEECSGKKKSKFQTFKNFFVKKKTKESPPPLGENVLKASQSSDDVTTEPPIVHTIKHEELGSKINMGNKAMSHDSVFVSGSLSSEALGASQDSIQGKVKSLQLQLKQAIRLGSPPAFIFGKKAEDTGAFSDDDDDGLPCSPPEYSSLHTVLATPAHTTGDTNQRGSCLSMEASDSDDDQMSYESSSRPGTPQGPVPADFSVPASSVCCLDSTAARHRIAVKSKACARRKPVSREMLQNKRRDRREKLLLREAEDKLRMVTSIVEEEGELIYDSDHETPQSKTTSISSEEVPDSIQNQKASPKSSLSTGDSSEEEERVSDQDHVLKSGILESPWESPVTLQLQADDFLLDTGCEVVPEGQGSLLEEVLSSLKNPLVSGLAVEHENMVQSEVADVNTQSVEAQQEEKAIKDLLGPSEPTGTVKEQVSLPDSLSDSTVFSEEITEEKEEPLEVPKFANVSKARTEKKLDYIENAKGEVGMKEFEEKLLEKTETTATGKEKDEDRRQVMVEVELERETKVDKSEKVNELMMVKLEKREDVTNVEQPQDVKRRADPSKTEDDETPADKRESKITDAENVAASDQTVGALNSIEISDHAKASGLPVVKVISSTVSHQPESLILHTAFSNTSACPLGKESESSKPHMSNRPQEVSSEKLEVVSEQKEVLEGQQTTSAEVRPRFTIAPAWQRSLASGVAKDQLQIISPLLPETEVTNVSNESAQRTELPTPPKEERFSKPTRTQSSPARIQSPPALPVRKEMPAVQEESTPDNPFGVRLRRTAVLRRIGLDEESSWTPTQKKQADSECLEAQDTPDIDQDESKPKKPDLLDTVMSVRKVSDPVGRISVGDAESPSWISVARQKQKNFIENSPEVSPENHPSQDFKVPDSLSSFSNSIAQEQLTQPCSTIKVFCSLEIANPSMVEKENNRTAIPSTAPLAQDEPPWMALAKKKAKAWSEMPQIVQ